MAAAIVCWSIPADYGIDTGYRWSQWLRLSTDDVVQVTPFRPPSQSFAATLLVVEISRVSKRAASTPLDLEASDLTMHLTTRMDGMVCVAAKIWWSMQL